MKAVLATLSMIAGLNAVHADELELTEPQIEEKRAAWGALPDEEKAARQAATKVKLQPTREAMQTKMQVRMANRPFGRR
ncbi:MAG TPA: hypothetical protein VN283_10160 [Thiobacillus sp.]|nr:hypothetical protein [Thiobacillus sp.]